MGSIKAKFSQFASRVGSIIRRKKTKTESIETIEESNKKEDNLIIENPKEEKEDKRIKIVEMRSRLPRKEEDKSKALSVAEQMEVERFVQTIKEEKVKYSEEELRIVLREEGFNERVIEEIVNRLVKKD